MDENKLISVIVPIYNVQLYLCECVESLLNQTYKNIEIILIDDGSTDASGAIGDRYAKMDKRVRIVHQNNQGLSAARNKGIELSQGDYLFFVDSDDFIEPSALERLYNRITLDDSQIAIGAMQRIGRLDSTRFGDLRDEIISGTDAVKRLYGPSSYVMTSICGKLFKKSLFETIRFPVGKMHEDNFITHKLYLKSDRISTASNYVYAYVFRNGSLTTKKPSIKNLDIIEAEYQRYQLFKHYPELNETLSYSSNMLINCFFQYTSVLGKPEKNTERYLEICRYKNEIVAECKERLSMKNRIKIICPFLYCEIKKIQDEKRG